MGLKSAAEFIVDKTTRVAGFAGRKVLGMPLHVAVPLGILFGVAVIVTVSRKAREVAEPRPDNSEI